jgi:hypothetical protein
VSVSAIPPLLPSSALQLPLATSLVCLECWCACAPVCVCVHVRIGAWVLGCLDVGFESGVSCGCLVAPPLVHTVRDVYVRMIHRQLIVEACGVKAQRIMSLIVLPLLLSPIKS